MSCLQHSGGPKGRISLFGRGKKQEIEFVEANTFSSLDLPSLIKNQDWESVLHRLRINPLDAEEELNVTTRGGFAAMSGYMALHYACERRPPVEVVEALIAACPKALLSRAVPGGALPLHIACTWYSTASAVNALIVADRSACKVQDELGNLALHSACFSGIATPVVESLLRAYPKAVFARNLQGSLPEDVVTRLRHENRRSVLALLHMCKEELMLKKQSKRGKSSGSMEGIANQAISLNER